MKHGKLIAHVEFPKHQAKYNVKCHSSATSSLTVSVVFSTAHSRMKCHVIVLALISLLANLESCTSACLEYYLLKSIIEMIQPYL